MFRTLVLALALAGPAAAAPLDITHQSRILGPDGGPINGVVDLSIALYDAEAGGRAVYSRTVTSTLVDGYVSVTLSPDDADLMQDLWVELSVDGVALPPRTALGSVPRARIATSVVGGTADVQSVSIDGNLVIDTTGAWVGDRKVASIGIHVRHWITAHGLALNIATDLDYFAAIRPCGLGSEEMTTMNALIGRVLDPTEVEAKLLAAYGEIFAVELVEVRREALITRADAPI